MDLRAEVDAKVDAETAWRDMFPERRDGANVTCANESSHEDGADRVPSMTLYPDGKAYCHACGFRAAGPVDVLAAAEELDISSAAVEAYSRWVEPLVPEAYIASCRRALEANKVALARLEERRGIGIKTLQRYEIGWDARRQRMVIPVRNALGLAVNARMYDLFGRWDGAVKMLSYDKGYGAARVWPLASLKNRELFLFEGEMDTLLALGLGLPAVTVTTGAATWKTEWNALFAGKDVVLVPDMDKAGLKGLAKREKALTCVASSVRMIMLAVKGDKGDKDFTDWVMRHGGTAEKLRAIAGRAEVDESGGQPLRSSKRDADLLTFKEQSPQEKTNLARAKEAFAWMTGNGSFFKNQSNDLFYAQKGGRAFVVHEKSETFLSFLSSRVSELINTATGCGRFVVRYILGQASYRNSRLTTGSWGLYANDAVFLYAGHDKVIRAKNGVLEVVKNASNEDGILLECPPDNKDFSPLFGVEGAEAVGLLWSRLLDYLPVSESDKYLLASWLLGVFVKERVRPKPLVRLMARTAYGKSTASKMISILLYGEENIYNSATTPAAIYVLAKQYPLILLDNIETHNMTPALQDFMLTAATGGTKVKRATGTDHGMVAERTNCLVLTNGIEPVNRRELVSRTTEITLDISKYGKKDFHETKVFAELAADRARMLCGLMALVSKYVVPRLRSGEVERIAQELGGHAKNRFDEYLGEMAVNLDALWLFRPSKDFANQRKMVNEWLQTQSASTEEQDEGTNDVLYYLSEFVDRHKALMDVQVKPMVLGGRVFIKAQTRTLFTDFRIMAKALGIKCPWQNERHLGTRIVDALPVLEKAGWKHSYKVINGKKYNEFVKEAAGALRDVDEGGVPGQGLRQLDVRATEGAARVGRLRGVPPANKNGVHKVGVGVRKEVSRG